MGLFPRFSPRVGALSFLGVCLVQDALSQLTECATSTNADFDYEVIPVPDFEIRWSLNTATDTISFEVVNSATAWTGLGFSLDGMMVPSDAVVGLPDEAAVMEFNLTGKTTESVIPYDEQEITGATVVQVAGGETTVTFTRPLAPTSADKQTLSSTPGDETWIIWASGEDNELGKHDAGDARGSVLVDLFCGAAEATATTTTEIDDDVDGDVGDNEETVAPTIGTLSPTTSPTTQGEIVTQSPTDASGDREGGTTPPPTSAGSDPDGIDQASGGAPRLSGGGGGAGWVSAASAAAGAAAMLKASMVL